MEKFQRAYSRFSRAFEKFREVVENPLFPEIFKEEFVVEITTKRFEFTYESMWKTVKEFLRLRGIECNSPRSCFKELLKEGVIDRKYEQTLYELITIRNTLVYVYDEEKAREIHNLIKEKVFIETFIEILKNIKEV
ncbi:MAG: DUF86 domain-containing protein [Aquificae bacterium]|nr:DUF86 domain-containing protein [Aquificota bacterium]